MKSFLSDDFLLDTETARKLYFDHAAKMPIYDYHCHLPAAAIASDRQFENLTQIWLAGDHYKWRAMRANGVDERYITGDASDWEKFAQWAATVPYCIRNPLYHWTHMELQNPFGISDQVLSPETAKAIYDSCSEKLRTKDYRVRNLLRKRNVKLICTTEDPLDSLEHHQQIRADGFDIPVHTAWRPDKAMAVDDLDSLNAWIRRLGQLTDSEIKTFEAYLEAIDRRHLYFHENGCRLSDHGIEQPYAEEYSLNDIQKIFLKIFSGSELNSNEKNQFRSAMLYELALMNHRRGWVQQFHLGALRNTNSRMRQQLGPDTGYDSMGDFEMAKPLAAFLDRLDRSDQLAKTILFNLNPRDNELFATMAGNFQGDGIVGKIQYGPAWWFLDQKDGIARHIEVLCLHGLLSRFVGMVTDSRSFLSYSRHEYFRRILCAIIGADVEKGELPKDMKWLGQIIEDICYHNACRYFSMVLS